MTTYYIDSSKTGGANNGTSWTDAWLSIGDMLADGVGVGTPLASGDIVYVASGSVDAFTYTGNVTVVGPTSGAPAKFISVTTGTTTYAASTTDQIAVTDGAYTLTWDGSFAFWGIQMASGLDIKLVADANEREYCYECNFFPGAGGTVQCSESWGAVTFKKCKFDCTADTTGTTNSVIYGNGSAYHNRLEVMDCTFTNIDQRTGKIFGGGGVNAYISGCDFSNVLSSTELVAPGGSYKINNCLTAATFSVVDAASSLDNFEAMLTNVGPSDRPWYIYHSRIFYGNDAILQATSSIYRSDGASVGGTAHSWFITNRSLQTDGYYYESPWIYGVLSSTGSKTFTIHIAQNGGTADVTDREVWMELEYLGTASEAIFDLASDWAGITTTGTAQDDDTTSTWTGITATYKQKLAVTATIAQAGLYRARVCCATGTDFYVDPKVVVT